MPYDLPDWMADPATPVLTFTTLDYREERISLSFLNARTGARFDPPLPSGVCGFFWIDGLHFGFLSDDNELVHIVDAADRKVEIVLISDEVLRYTHTDCRPGGFAFLTLRPSGLSDEGYILMNPVTADHYSALGTYSAAYPAVEYGEEGSLQVKDNRTGKIVWESSNQDGFFEFSFSWSAVDDHLLAATRGKSDPDFDDFIAKDMYLDIIDAVAGEIVKSLPGPFGRTEWSPDGTRILFLPPHYSYALYGVAFRDAPCILSMDSWKIQCPQSIPASHIPDGFRLITTGRYRWTGDGKYLSYLSLYGSSDPDLGVSSDVCLYHLADGSIRCPTDDVELPSDLTIMEYDISPDGQFVHFCYGNTSILNDFSDDSWDGVIAIDGSGYRTWNSTVLEDGSPGCAVGLAWRPIPGSTTG